MSDKSLECSKTPAAKQAQDMVGGVTEVMAQKLKENPNLAPADMALDAARSLFNELFINNETCGQGLSPLLKESDTTRGDWVFTGRDKQGAHWSERGFGDKLTCLSDGSIRIMTGDGNFGFNLSPEGNLTRIVSGRTNGLRKVLIENPDGVGLFITNKDTFMITFPDGHKKEISLDEVRRKENSSVAAKYER